MSHSLSELSLEVNSLCKRFGQVHALDNVSIEFSRGQIHAIVGENGAGKSTLVNILAGNLRQDSGSIVASSDKNGPAESVAMVHQHFMLVPALTVRENLQLAASKRTPGIRLHNLELELNIAKAIGWDLPLESRILDLSVGIQQRIEIVKALAEEKPILVLDEPTAVLSQDEVADLMEQLRILRSQGKTIVLIAHKLSEVMAVADQITVLRGGRVVASEPASSVNAEQVAVWMVGDVSRVIGKQLQGIFDGQLDLENVCVDSDRGNEAVTGVAFSVKRGEIVGIGGVDGNGQVELAEAVAGIRSHRGSIVFPLTKDESNGGAVYIPQDRHRDGLALQMSVFENLLIGLSGRHKLGLIPLGDFRKQATKLVEKYDVRTNSIDDPIRTLSGGNQQKVIVARSLEQNPDVIAAVNPTRGLDVRATVEVHRKLIEAAESGVAVLVFSTDMDELNAIASRSFYMSRGALKSSLVEALSGDI